MEQIGPKTFFSLSFLLTFRRCNSPTFLSSCVARITGACPSPPRSWLCSWELGRSTWGSVGCQHPCLDTGSQDLLLARTCKLLHFWSLWVSRLRVCCLAPPFQSCRLGLAASAAPAPRPCLQAKVLTAKSPWQSWLSGLAQCHRARERGPAFAHSPRIQAGIAYLIW